MGLLRSKVGHSRLHFVTNVYNGVATSASASVFGSRRERDVDTRGLESEELVDDNMIIDEHDAVDAVFLSRPLPLKLHPGVTVVSWKDRRIGGWVA
jgi:hypothetical protein